MTAPSFLKPLPIDTGTENQDIELGDFHLNFPDKRNNRFVIIKLEFEAFNMGWCSVDEVNFGDLWISPKGINGSFALGFVSSRDDKARAFEKNKLTSYFKSQAFVAAGHDGSLASQISGLR